MRWILVALLTAGTAWAADDEEKPRRPTPAAREELRLLDRAAGEKVAAEVMIPSGALLNAGGIVAVILGAIMSFGNAQCAVHCDPVPGETMVGAGVSMFVLGIAATSWGGVMYGAAKSDRRKANPWLASVRF